MATTAPAAIASVKLSSIRQSLAFVALVALLYMVLIGLQPFAVRVAAQGADKGGGDFIDQLWYTATMLIVIGVAQPWRAPRRLLVLPVSMVVALGWCALSLTWALAPEIGARRLILTAMIVFTVFCAVDQLGPEKSANAARTALVIAIALSYVAMVVSPVAVHQNTELGTTNLVGSWRGAFDHKNFAGPACAVTIIMFVFDAARVKIWLRVLVIAATAYFLVRTQSKTSIALLALALVAGAAYLRYNPRYRLLLIPALLITGCAIGWVVLADWDSLTAPLNDQTALTGRVQIWPPMLRYLGEHWQTGAGFGSFWNIGERGPMNEYAKGWVLSLGNGHEGYLDLATQIGVPGLVLVVLAAIVIPIARLLVTPGVARQRGALGLALLVFCAGHNFSETSLFDRDAIVQVVMMLAIALIDQATRSPRLRRFALAAPVLAESFGTRAESRR